MAVLEGGCLCGAVRYEVDAEIRELRACHCKDCQKASGTNWSVNAVLPAAALKILRGTPRRYDATAASGRTLHRFFCGDCGSPLFSRRESTPQVIVLRAGTLDRPVEARVTAHIWTASRQPWSHIDPEATQLPGNPQ